MENNTEMKIFQWENWEIMFKCDNKNQTIWWNLNQIAELFWKDKSTISRHIKNIFKTWELKERQVVAFFATTASDWKTYNVEYFNIDMIISIWYRVNSKQATSFRIWSTNVIKEYLLKWYSINKKRIQERWYKELEETINLFKKTIKSSYIWKDDAIWLLEIITNYTDTWLLLQNYDEDNLKQIGNTINLDYKLEAKEAFISLLELKTNLKNKKEATDLFAQLRENDWLKWIFWNIYQTFWWKDLYESVEEKAANLLYFLVKDHPFTDWNKRSWAFLFILFLAKNHILLDENWNKKINDRALVAITLLIAESDPKNKDLMVKLLINLIN